MNTEKRSTVILQLLPALPVLAKLARQTVMPGNYRKGFLS